MKHRAGQRRRVRVVTVTSVVDGLAHAVTAEALAAGPGHYRARCGQLVRPAVLVAPDGRPCPGCRERR